MLQDKENAMQEMLFELRALREELSSCKDTLAAKDKKMEQDRIAYQKLLAKVVRMNEEQHSQTSKRQKKEAIIAALTEQLASGNNRNQQG